MVAAVGCLAAAVVVLVMTTPVIMVVEEEGSSAWAVGVIGTPAGNNFYRSYFLLSLLPTYFPLAYYISSVSLLSPFPLFLAPPSP